MSIITLTNDFGESDYFVAALKGKILSLNQNVNIIDISHQIKAFQINHAAYVLKNSYHHFPKKTVHLIGVLSMDSKENKFLILEKNDHFCLFYENNREWFSRAEYRRVRTWDCVVVGPPRTGHRVCRSTLSPEVIFSLECEVNPSISRSSNFGFIFSL